MQNYPKNLVYTKDHEWALVTDNIIRVGITQFAVDQLGDVTMVDLPSENQSISKGVIFGSIESVKAVSDLFAPITGTVTKINSALFDAPELINDAPYDNGWMIEVSIDDPNELKELLTATDYEAFIAQ